MIQTAVWDDFARSDMTQPSEMKEQPFPYYLYNQEELAFYIMTNDHDMLSKVNQFMAQSGCVGIMDTAGRMHYLIDGRRGAPYASRRILETADRILFDRQRSREPLVRIQNQVVDSVLSRHGFRPELKGSQYLRCMLLIIGLDESKIKPVSKKLYPLVAEKFRVQVSQVERDIRYALRESDLYAQGLTPTASICRLHREVVQMVEQAQAQKLYDETLDPKT